MVPTLDRPLRVLATLWVGLMAGFFFAFSVVVMPGLDQTAPLAALTSMQAINAAVNSAAFALGFFGAAVLCLGLAIAALRQRQGAALLGLVAALVYLIGVFGVTVSINVPLNDALATLDPNLSANASAMATYIADWTAANHVRTLAGLVAFALLAMSLLWDRRGGLSNGTAAN